MSSMNPAPSLPFSERLLEGLRNEDLSVFGEGPPCAAALLPLLKALGWSNFSRELAEALPHFSEHFDLIDLRNVLVSLGYESQAHPGRLADINPQLYPCLYVGRDGHVLVLLEHLGDRIRYYDTLTGKEQEGKPNLPGAGTAYAFTDISHEPLAAARQAPESWSKNLLRRFRGLLIYLLTMTFLINLVALAVPLSIMLVYDKVIGSRSEDTLIFLLAGVFIALCVDFGLRMLRARLLGTVAGRIDYLIGVETFRRLLYMPPLYTERSSVSAQLSRLKQFDSVRDFLTGNAASVLLELPFGIISIIIIGLIAGPLAWAPIITILIYVLLALLLSGPMCREQQRHGLAKISKQSMMLQTLEGLAEIRGTGAGATWLERFRETSGENAAAAYKAAFVTAAVTSVGQMVMGLSALAVVGWGAFMVMGGQLSIGGLIAVMALTWRILSPMQSAYLNIPQARQIRKSLQQIDQLMKIDTERYNSHTARLLTDLKGNITVDRVAFRYGPDQDPAVLGATFRIKVGELIAITGATGSGKSTLLKLMAGMYQPQAGAIALDEIDIRQLDATDLRRSIAYVPQDIKMFHGTIAQNLRLNNGLASRAELEAALGEAGMLEEVMALPDGLDTRIGDNITQHFPPGFIHGLALARALVRPAPILLLDEPGTSLDMKTDQILMQNLKRMRGRFTVIMVSHRPSHIRLADRAIHMHQGSIKFVGDPEKVVAHLMEQQT